MNWRIKALAQQLFSRVPGGGRLNLLMQTRITHSLPASPARFVETQHSAEAHLAAVCAALGTTDPTSLHGYEFGAGWHLAGAISLAGLGVGSQTLVDRDLLAHPDLVRHSLRALGELQPANGRLSAAARASDVPHALEALDISYLAPVDARHTGLPDDTFDFVTSTSTLEHIPAPDLDDLLRECWRLLRPGGAFSAVIDYGDHYAGFDSSITRLNFLKFPPARWRLYSPPLQFQSRLRHSDYMQRIEAVGFEIRDVSTVPIRDEDVSWVSHDTIDPSFHRYPLDDLTIGDAHIVAVKP